jgi:CBS domain-containing protein
MLRRQGVKAEVIAEIVSDLNRRLSPNCSISSRRAELRARACLIVMGSEGRGEQTVRTDQDNGLILVGAGRRQDARRFPRRFLAGAGEIRLSPVPGQCDGAQPHVVEAARRISRRLPSLGRAAGRRLPHECRDLLRRRGRRRQSRLLEEAKRALIQKVQGERVYLAHFAKAIEAFPTPIGFFNNLITAEGNGDAVDLKKGGIFPIVHGVRSFAIERGITETSTSARIAKLVEAGALKPEFGRELTQSFQFLMSLRLDSQLSESGSLMKPATLSSMERDLLRDAFQVVKQFREIVRRHFNLSMFG